MRHIQFLFLMAFACFQPSLAQVGAVERWHLAGGLTSPAAPDQFYDYWKQGFQIMGGAEFSSQTRFLQLITAEVNYFPFDQERFLKRLGIDNGRTTISGSAAYILSLTYLIKYPFTEYSSFQPAFFAGLGCASSIRSSATIEYPNYPVSQETKSSVVAIVPFGVSIRVYERQRHVVEVNFTYTIGLSKSQTVNSNYSCLKLDYSFAP